MYCVGVSYKKTQAEVRERFAFSDEEKSEFISALLKENLIDACVILSTCNRSEIYFTGANNSTKDSARVDNNMDQNAVDSSKGLDGKYQQDDLIEYMEQKLIEYKGIDSETVKNECLVFADKRAVKHLYKVCCGLDSMVLGEVEIIRQIKDAYQFSVDNNFVNKEINVVFQGSLNASKEIQSKTKLAYCPVSIGTLAARAVEDFCKNNDASNVLIVGASGKTGSIVLKDLLDLKIPNLAIIGTGRKPSLLKAEYEDYPNVGIASYDDRYNYIKWADVIVSATSSPHYTFVAEKCQKHFENENKNQLFLDLAVPRDIDKAIGKLDKKHLMDIDYFNKLAKANNEMRISESNNAKLILDEKIDEIMKSMKLQDFVANNREAKELLEGKNGMWLIYQLRDKLGEEQFSEIIEYIKDIY